MTGPNTDKFVPSEEISNSGAKVALSDLPASLTWLGEYSLATFKVSKASFPAQQVLW